MTAWPQPPRRRSEQCGWAISYAVQQASGVPIRHRDPEHVGKAFDFFGGMGARIGVTAALMAAGGLSGVADPRSPARMAIWPPSRLPATLPDDRIAIVDIGRMPDVCLQHLLALTLTDGGLS